MVYSCILDIMLILMLKNFNRCDVEIISYTGKQKFTDNQYIFYVVMTAHLWNKKLSFLLIIQQKTKEKSSKL